MKRTEKVRYSWHLQQSDEILEKVQKGKKNQQKEKEMEKEKTDKYVCQCV